MSSSALLTCDIVTVEMHVLLQRGYIMIAYLQNFNYGPNE